MMMMNEEIFILYMELYIQGQALIDVCAAIIIFYISYLVRLSNFFFKKKNKNAKTSPYIVGNS